MHGRVSDRRRPHRRGRPGEGVEIDAGVAAREIKPAIEL